MAIAIGKKYVDNIRMFVEIIPIGKVLSGLCTSGARNPKYGKKVDINVC